MALITSSSSSSCCPRPMEMESIINEYKQFEIATPLERLLLNQVTKFHALADNFSKQLATLEVKNAAKERDYRDSLKSIAKSIKTLDNSTWEKIRGQFEELINTTAIQAHAESKKTSIANKTPQLSVGRRLVSPSQVTTTATTAFFDETEMMYNELKRTPLSIANWAPTHSFCTAPIEVKHLGALHPSLSLKVSSFQKQCVKEHLKGLRNLPKEIRGPLCATLLPPNTHSLTLIRRFTLLDKTLGHMMLRDWLLTSCNNQDNFDSIDNELRKLQFVKSVDIDFSSIENVFSSIKTALSFTPQPSDIALAEEVSFLCRQESILENLEILPEPLVNEIVFELARQARLLHNCADEVKASSPNQKKEVYKHLALLMSKQTKLLELATKKNRLLSHLDKLLNFNPEWLSDLAEHANRIHALDLTLTWSLPLIRKAIEHDNKIEHDKKPGYELLLKSFEYLSEAIPFLDSDVIPFSEDELSYFFRYYYHRSDQTVPINPYTRSLFEHIKTEVDAVAMQRFVQAVNASNKPFMSCLVSWGLTLDDLTLEIRTSITHLFLSNYHNNLDAFIDYFPNLKSLRVFHSHELRLSTSCDHLEHLEYQGSGAILSELKAPKLKTMILDCEQPRLPINLDNLETLHLKSFTGIFLPPMNKLQHLRIKVKAQPSHSNWLTYRLPDLPALQSLYLNSLHNFHWEKNSSDNLKIVELMDCYLKSVPINLKQLERCAVYECGSLPAKISRMLNFNRYNKKSIAVLSITGMIEDWKKQHKKTATSANHGDNVT